MIRNILTVPHIVLSTPSLPAFPESLNAQQLYEDMYDTLNASERGIGLAAPQIAVAVQAVLLKTTTGHLFMMNPKYVWTSGNHVNTVEECLSVINFKRERTRHSSIKLKYLDIGWTPRVVTLEKLESVCAQHEIDHIFGRTLIDP